MADDFQISTLDMAKVNPALGVTEGFAYDAPYLYVTPHNNYVIAKVDTRTFKIVDTLDLSKVDPGLIALLGSFVAGGFLYLLPHLSDTGPTFQSNVVRVDLANFTPAGCSMLKVFSASQALNALNGRTDGIHGYLNMHVGNRVLVTRFGLGADFNPASISSVSIPTIDGMPVVQGSLVAVDKSAAYVLTKVLTNPGTGHNDGQSDLWLTTIPTANFTAAAATFQRLTNVHYLRSPVSIAIDDGENLWVPPMPIPSGPLAGKFVGVIKVPKANPAAVEIFQGPASQPYPPPTWISGVPLYDGRYGYVPSATTQQILQIDTQNPGVINMIDVSAHSGGYPLWGLGYDGHWAYAASYNGGAGLCLRFLPTHTPSAS
jgi:hypothetical protein